MQKRFAFYGFTKTIDTAMKYFPPSELIVNADGSIFHLHVHPSQLADKVLLVGDPGRVAMVSSMLDSQECSVSNREFNTVTGTYRGKRITVVSTGIGTDNIDIVMNELDALANIDLSTRTEKAVFRQLHIVRVGTCGAIQADIPTGSFLVSEKSVGIDGVLHFYEGRDRVSDMAFESAFKEHVGWHHIPVWPYVVDNDSELVARIGRDDMMRGVTVSANGFYGPQGRVLRLAPADPKINDKLETFRYGKHRITNYEMEGSAVAGLSALMGHRAVTVCCVIANRHAKVADIDYRPRMEELVRTVLERI